MEFDNSFQQDVPVDHRDEYVKVILVSEARFPLPELTGNGNRSPVNSGSGNRALAAHVLMTTEIHWATETEELREFD